MEATAQEPNVAKQVLACVSYFDTVEIYQKPTFKSPLLKYMRAHCGSIVSGKFPTYGGRVKYTLKLNQPDRKAIAFLLDKGVTVFQVHVALDLIVPTRSAADELHSYVLARQMPSVVPFSMIKKFETTSYFHFDRRRGPAKNLVIYSSKPSRTHAPYACCHIEYRLRGSAPLRRDLLRELNQLLNFDHRQFWQKSLHLKEDLDTDALGERMLDHLLARTRVGANNDSGRERLHIPYGGRTTAPRRLGGFARRLIPAEDQGNVNDLLRVLRQYELLQPKQVAELLRPIASDWMLPPPQNILWRKVAIRNSVGPTMG